MQRKVEKSALIAFSAAVRWVNFKSFKLTFGHSLGGATHPICSYLSCSVELLCCWLSSRFAPRYLIVYCAVQKITHTHTQCQFSRGAEALYGPSGLNAVVVKSLKGSIWPLDERLQQGIRSTVNSV